MMQIFHMAKFSCQHILENNWLHSALRHFLNLIMQRDIFKKGNLLL